MTTSVLRQAFCMAVASWGVAPLRPNLMVTTSDLAVVDIHIQRETKTAEQPQFTHD